MFDPHTRESRGFGFVTMKTSEEADAAIDGLNNTELGGKTMRVEKVRFVRSSRSGQQLTSALSSSGPPRTCPHADPRPLLRTSPRRLPALARPASARLRALRP